MIDLGDYRIRRYDSLNWITERRTFIQEHRFAKPENVGTEKWVFVAYHSRVREALKSLPDTLALDPGVKRLATLETRWESMLERFVA